MTYLSCVGIWKKRWEEHKNEKKQNNNICKSHIPAFYPNLKNNKNDNIHESLDQEIRWFEAHWQI